MMFDVEQMYCLNCEQQTYRETRYKGSFIGEVAFYLMMGIVCAFTTWLLMLIPLAYSLMRATSGTKGCEKCGSDNLVPLDSPKAQRMIQKQQE